ncbi:MAG: hypothetical protein P9X24_02245 [Candidatus Hatepunaea meridiana]|nr:hypothetical protein [Candidatus Hatepunaea meridiana]
MKRIINKRRCILVLPQSKLILKPRASIIVDELTEELQKAITKGWIKLEDEGTKASEAGSQVPDSEDSNSKAHAHDWEVDYSHADEGEITVSDKLSGRQITGEIDERKGEQHFTLKDIGTVKKQQFWPRAQALKHFDGNE